jgi:hypothetical protein
MATLMTPFIMGRVLAAERPLNGCRSCLGLAFDDFFLKI